MQALGRAVTATAVSHVVHVHMYPAHAHIEPGRIHICTRPLDSTSARTKPSGVHIALMSLGSWEAVPAPLFWLRPRLFVSYRAFRVESGRQRLYFRSASFLRRRTLLPPDPLSFMKELGSLLSRARSRRRSPLCLACQAASPCLANAQGGTRVERLHLSLTALDSLEGRAVASAAASASSCAWSSSSSSSDAAPSAGAAPRRAEDHYYAGLSNEGEFLK
ncbi:hypothetical protein C8J57DRAFT_1733377 [Mycena rebaudengoi]|nr:hypothetical protein C8J57DRAFT_1733377 [Mycena rebaudengoi]